MASAQSRDVDVEGLLRVPCARMFTLFIDRGVPVDITKTISDLHCTLMRHVWTRTRPRDAESTEPAWVTSEPRVPHRRSFNALHSMPQLLVVGDHDAVAWQRHPARAPPQPPRLPRMEELPTRMGSKRSKKLIETMQAKARSESRSRPSSNSGSSQPWAPRPAQVSQSRLLVFLHEALLHEGFLPCMVPAQRRSEEPLSAHSPVTCRPVTAGGSAATGLVHTPHYWILETDGSRQPRLLERGKTAATRASSRIGPAGSVAWIGRAWLICWLSPVSGRR